MLSYLLAIVCYFLTTGREFTNEHFFMPIEHTHHSNDCSNRGMECYFATRSLEALTWDTLVDEWVHRGAWLYVENTNLMLTQYSMTNGVTFPS